MTLHGANLIFYLPNFHYYCHFTVNPSLAISPYRVSVTVTSHHHLWEGELFFAATDGVLKTKFLKKLTISLGFKRENNAIRVSARSKLPRVTH